MGGILACLASSGGLLSLIDLTIAAVAAGFGFQNGVAGAVSPNTYIDHGTNTRTVVQLYHATGFGMVMRLSGVITDNDTAFVALVVNGTRLARSAATYSTDSSTYSQWNWTNSDLIGTSGHAFVGVQ